ncbi:MAG TPA: hypothetical protein VEW66_07695 [Thermomicrobiales bacterium]|nr:hypothetical protein [Thermomicrobiales bacterium]
MTTSSGTQDASAAEETGSESVPPEPWDQDQPEDSPPTEAVDEETGILLDDPDAEPISGVVDASELDVLVADPEANKPVVVNEDAPDLSQMEDEAVSSTPDDERDSTNDQDTIAAWAQEWSGDDQAEAPPSSAVDDDDDPEVTVAKAERLIAELQSLVPRLARPKPADPSQALIPTRLAEELESATGETQWEDLREILVQARDHPNDITYLMGVSGNAGRLLELMENRDSLANTASNVARRLRNPVPDEQA